VEEYCNKFKRNSRYDMRSSFKSITSLLAGIAVDKKLITIDDKLIKHFPELKNSDKGNITSRSHLL